LAKKGQKVSSDSNCPDFCTSFPPIAIPSRKPPPFPCKLRVIEHRPAGALRLRSRVCVAERKDHLTWPTTLFLFLTFDDSAPRCEETQAIQNSQLP
jgi:hypothetical protein